MLGWAIGQSQRIRMLRALKNTAHLLLAIIANMWYGFPSQRLRVIAVTGTDGKTTSSSLLYHVLKSSGKKVALISTVAAFIGDKEIDTGFHVTTPSPFALQKLLRTIADRDLEFVVLEVTSHGIDQNRVWGIIPEYAGITNVTREHLDYHGTYEKYVATKAKLLLASTHAYVNDDAKLALPLLSDILGGQHKEAKHFSVKTLPKLIRDAATLRFPEQVYNLENTALVTAITRDCGLSEKDIAKAIKTFPGVKGRMEEIPNKRGLRIIVDFAHTPNALEQAIRAADPTPASAKAAQRRHQRKSGRLIVVFGCAGLRDTSKRPVMGEIATRLADFVVLTAEDPRTEDTTAIIAQIKSGVKTGHDKLASIPDRYQAIQFALNTIARPGDTVLITGKGHERSMCFGTTEYPWSDQDAVRKILSAQAR